MEKLAVSVALYFQAYREECRFDPTMPDRSMDYAAKAITRIGKAYVEGELELPGEVGRYRCSDETVVLFEYLEKWAADMYNEDADEFIALRKERTDKDAD